MSEISASVAAEIAKLCNDAGEPAMAVALLSEGVSLDEARVRVDYAGKVNEMIAMSRRMAPALQIPADFLETAIAERKSVAAIRADLLDMMACADEAKPISGHRLTGDGSGGKTTA